jgi:hypothetical protein
MRSDKPTSTGRRKVTMTGEGIDSISKELLHESQSVRDDVTKFLEMLTTSFGSTDRVDGPNNTRLFALAVLSKTTKRFNQYVAVTTNRHCNMNHPVDPDSFRIQVQTKDVKPGEGWYPGRFPQRAKGKEWWEYNPESQQIGQPILRVVEQARGSMQR